ncbi:MAG: deoxynucleoside kinase [Candidatus Woykebacteria bacterium]
MQKRPGKLIVIEGTDGSGKATQASLLKSALAQKNYPVESIEFPRYKESFHGKTIERYLKGEFGEVAKVSPYLVSLAYSLDRVTAKREMNAWLRAGKIVLANRYATSNMAYSGANIPDPEKDKFLHWLLELEYKVNKIPKEDLVIYLHVPVAVAKVLIKGRGRKSDIHEENFEYLTKTEKMYDLLSKRFKHWVKVSCVGNNGVMRSKDSINKEIVGILKKHKIVMFDSIDYT